MNPMNTKKTTIVLLTLLLLAVPAMADPADEDEQTADDCAVVDILLYDPYIVVRPACLPLPLGQG